MIIMAQSHELVYQHRDLVVSLLSRLGFILNLEKSDLTPAHRFTFLGLIWDTSLCTVALTEEKVAHLQSDARILLSKGRVTGHDLQRFLRRTNFAGVAVPRARLFSHAIQSCLSATYKWPSHSSRFCPLSEDAKMELSWGYTCF